MIQSTIRLEKYVASMEVERHTYQVLVRQTKRKRPFGKPGHKWKDIITTASIHVRCYTVRVRVTVVNVGNQLVFNIMSVCLYSCLSHLARTAQAPHYTANRDLSCANHFLFNLSHKRNDFWVGWGGGKLFKKCVLTIFSKASVWYISKFLAKLSETFS